MKLFKVDGAVLLQTATAEYKVENLSWDALVNQENLYDFLAAYAITHEPIASIIDGKQLEAPIGSQEIWAAGVTYLRSKEARMDEAKDSGAADFYAKVYEAKRPELFFKSTVKSIRFFRTESNGKEDYLDNEIKKRNQDDIQNLIKCVI